MLSGLTVITVVQLSCILAEKELLNVCECVCVGGAGGVRGFLSDLHLFRSVYNFCPERGVCKTPLFFIFK